MLTQLSARRDSLRVRLEFMAADDPGRPDLEAMLKRLNLMLSPAVPSPKVMRKLKKAQEDMDGGILVATIPYDDERELRVFVKLGQSSGDVCLKLYHLHRGIRQMVPTSHGMTLKGEKLGALISAMTNAQQYIPTKRLAL